MSSWLTDARTEFIARLQANAHLAATIRTWITFGSGLQQRLIIEPNLCPLCCVSPHEGAMDQRYNVLAEYPQKLQIDLATAEPDQDPAPLEELLTEGIYRVVQEACADDLGLAADGCKGVFCEGTNWIARADKEAARLIWIATTTVRIGWIRTQPHA